MESLRDNLVSEINQLHPKSPRTQIVLSADVNLCWSDLCGNRIDIAVLAQPPSRDQIVRLTAALEPDGVAV